MDGGAWKAAVHGVPEGWTQLSDFIFTFHFHALEKEMATHSSVLAWRIPGMGEPGGLPSMGSHRVGHDWSDLAAAAAFFAILHSDAYIFPFLLCFSLLFFSQLFLRPPQTAILLFCISFHGDGFDPCLCTMSRTSIHSSSGTLSIRSSPLNLFLISTVQS